jgi:hypothetical protein
MVNFINNPGVFEVMTDGINSIITDEGVAMATPFPPTKMEPLYVNVNTNSEIPVQYVNLSFDEINILHSLVKPARVDDIDPNIVYRLIAKELAEKKDFYIAEVDIQAGAIIGDADLSKVRCLHLTDKGKRAINSAIFLCVPVK